MRGGRSAEQIEQKRGAMTEPVTGSERGTGSGRRKRRRTGSERGKRSERKRLRGSGLGSESGRGSEKGKGSARSGREKGRNERGRGRGRSGRGREKGSYGRGRGSGNGRSERGEEMKGGKGEMTTGPLEKHGTTARQGMYQPSQFILTFLSISCFLCLFCTLPQYTNCTG